MTTHLLCKAVSVTILALTIGAISFTSSAFAQVTAEDVEGLKDELAKTRVKAETLIKTQADLYEQLAALDHELELSSRLLRELRLQIHELTGEVGATTDTLSALQGVSQTERELFARRLRRINFVSDDLPLLAPFASSASVKMQDNSIYFRKMVAQDNLRLAALGSAISSREEILASLEERKSELEEAVLARRREESNMKETLRQRERLLAEVKGEQHELDRQLNQLQESSATVGDIFTTLEDELRRTTDQLWQQQRELNLQLKGNLHWPVQGRVVTGFGTTTDRRTGLSSKSNGINIATSSNHPVVAALTGRVLYIGFARGLENFLVVDHGGSIYSLYGNLSSLEVSEGESVIRGEPFAKTAGDRLHFEIRDGKNPVDPRPWLR